MSVNWRHPKDDEHELIIGCNKSNVAKDVVQCVAFDIILVAGALIGIGACIKGSGYGLVLAIVSLLLAAGNTYIIISGNRTKLIKSRSYCVCDCTVTDRSIPAASRNIKHYVTVLTFDGKKYKLKVRSGVYHAAAVGRRALIVKYLDDAGKEYMWDLVIRRDIDDE